MGCWNETCFLTGLPIFAGQPVKLIFIAHDGNGGWLPAALPVHGYYDDYGGIESAVRDEAALQMLRRAEFRAATGGESGPEPFENSGLYNGKWEESLRQLTEHAARDELEMLVPGRNPCSEEWHAATVLMAHAWAWDHFVDAVEAVPYGLLTSVTFRLKTSGPLRLALRDISCSDCPDPETPTARGIISLAKLMSAMDAMRVSFHPTNGKGSQDGMDDDWQLAFQKKRFVAAMAIPHRYDELPQAPFSAAMAYEDGGVTYDRNNGSTDVTDMPENLSPRDVYKRVLEAGIDNILDAMAEAGHEEE